MKSFVPFTFLGADGKYLLEHQTNNKTTGIGGDPQGRLRLT